MKRMTAEKAFVEPENVADLYDRAYLLSRRIDFHANRAKEIKAAQGEFDLLDGVTPVDLMTKVFDKRKSDWNDAETVPTARVYHVDHDGYISTTVFHQPRTVTTWQDRVKRSKAELDKIVKEFRATNGVRDGAFEAVVQKLRGNAHAFTGLEIVPIVTVLASKKLHKLATNVTRATETQALTVGALDNIIRAKPEWGGDRISDALHGMLGTTLDVFARDEGGVLFHPKGPEDLTELLNEFKAGIVKKTLSAYERHALRGAFENNGGKPLSVDEIRDAQRKARTALFLRQQYDALAKMLEPTLKELQERKSDVASPNLRPERAKAYRPEDFIEGKVRHEVYDQGFHEAVETLHRGLRLEGESSDGLSDIIARMAQRKNSSIFSGNIKTGLSNFFDAGVPTLAKYGGEFPAAAAALSTDKELATMIDRLPILPQANMEYIRLREAAQNRKPTDNPYLKAVHAFEDFQLSAGEKLDPVFRGREKIVSAADTIYTRAAAVTVLAREGRKYGYTDVKTFVRDLKDVSKFSQQQRTGIWSNVSKDLTELYNSIAPHLNRDLFSTSKAGKFFANYSSPQRRNFRWVWDRSRRAMDGDAVAQKELAGALILQTLLGGRAVVPKTFQLGLIYMGATAAAASSGYIPGNQKVAETFQNLDNMNIFRQATGWDLSERMGFDVANLASPVGDLIKDFGAKGLKSIRGTKDDSSYSLPSLSAAAAFALIQIAPKWGMFGADNLTALGKNLSAAARGEKKHYVSLPDGALLPVIQKNYTYMHALNDWLRGGIPREAFAAKQQAEMQHARNMDAKAQQVGRVRSLLTPATRVAPSAIPLLAPLNPKPLSET
jgi:hypothetical protein